MDKLSYFVDKKLLTQQHVDTYRLFNNEFAKKWIDNVMRDMGMVEPPEDLNPQVLAFAEGKRAFVRKIYQLLNDVETLLNNEGMECQYYQAAKPKG